MNYTILAGPIIGSVIGYCTNYIAVRMLFRPLHPIKIGKFRVPFTPGIIPKGKERLGKALGEAIGGTLLTEEEITKTMLSTEMKEKIGFEIRSILQRNETNQKEIGCLIKEYISEDNYNSKVKDFSDAITDKLVEKALELSIGTIIANETVRAIQEKVQGTILTMMVNEEMLQSFANPISERIDRYISENGYKVLEPQVQNEIIKASEKTVGELSDYLNKSNINIEEIVIRVYETFVKSRLGSIMKQIDIRNIVERKVSEMDVLELEELVLSVMKKELNAIVNLGALIGFILGLINIIF